LRQPSEQNFTSFQLRAQRLRQVIARPQAAHGLEGSDRLFPLNAISTNARRGVTLQRCGSRIRAASPRPWPSMPGREAGSADLGTTRDLRFRLAGLDALLALPWLGAAGLHFNHAATSG
jgi:hypothetical protein